MSPESYVDVLLPKDSGKSLRLRLYDITDRWIRVADLSSVEGYIPEDDSFYDLPYGAFDSFALDEPIVVGRNHNPDHLPALAEQVVSREHFSLRVSLGNRGLVLAIKDLGSHNGTEIVMNDSLTPYTAEEALV